MAFEAVLYIGVLLLFAKIFGELFHRIKQPTILGHVIAGIIVGPALFSIVQPIDEIDLFISIGVFFLFFLIGLEEIDVPGLFRILRKRIFMGAVIGFFIPFISTVILGLTIEMELVTIIAIGSVIGASSLGVTAKILSDLGKLRSTLGLEIFTITALVEFIAIIFTSVAIQISSTTSLEIGGIAWLFVRMLLFFGFAGAFALFVIPHLMRIIKKHVKAKEIYFGLVVSFILLVAYFAEISGIHGAIGALLLGVSISRMPREEYFEISKSLRAVGYGIFIPMFFAGIGLHFAVDFLEMSIWIIIGFLTVLIGTKFLGSYIATKFARLRPTKAVAYGLMSKGAVDLALLLALLESDLLEKNLFSLLVFGTLIVMVISGVMLQNSLKKYVQVKVGTSDLGIIPLYFRRALTNFRASEVMKEKFEKIPHDIFVSDYVKNYPNSMKVSNLVFDDNDNLIGVVSKKELKKFDKKLWPQLTIGNIVDPNISVVSPEEYLFGVTQKINSHHFDLVPVMIPSSKKVLGIITSQMILNLLVLEEKK